MGTPREVADIFRAAAAPADFPAAVPNISRDLAAALAPSQVREDSRPAKVSLDVGAFRAETGDSPAGSVLQAARAALIKPAEEAIIAVVDFTAAVMAPTTAASIPVTATDSATTAAPTAILMATMISGATGFPAAGSIPTTAAATTVGIKIAA